MSLHLGYNFQYIAPLGTQTQTDYESNIPCQLTYRGPQKV